ncbi:hypothetical protein [Halocatena halophila]|uniref:hypothetical protein n=1 Tax=Halocatena halophila TaxID=2814576 RepID=UPI002ED074F6
MPTRRRVLQLGCFAAGGLVGSALTSNGAGTPANFGGSIQRLPASVAPTAAFVRRSSEDCPYGNLGVETRVQEYDRGDQRLLACTTEVRVITGRSGCSSGKGHAGVDLKHTLLGELDRVPPNPTRRSTVVPTDERDSHTALLNEDHTETTSFWRVRLRSGQKSTTSYTFATTFERPADVTARTPLLDVTAEVPVPKLVYGTHTMQLTATLRYDEIEEA